MVTSVERFSPFQHKSATKGLDLDHLSRMVDDLRVDGTSYLGSKIQSHIKAISASSPTIRIALGDPETVETALVTLNDLALAPTVFDSERKIANGSRIRQAAVDVVVDNLDGLGRVVRSGSPVQREYAFSIVSALTNQDVDFSDQYGVDFLLDNFERVFENAPDKLALVDYATTLLLYARGKQEKDFQQMFLGYMKREKEEERVFVPFALADITFATEWTDSREEDSSMVGLNLREEFKERTGVDALDSFRASLNQQIRAANLDIKPTTDAWLASGSRVTDGWTRIFTNNFREIKALESKRPGICRVLAEDFGIRDFGRYPTALLIDQFDFRNDKERPYGLLMFSYDDWDGGLYNSVGTYSKLYEDLKGQALLRVVETGSKFSAFRRLMICDNRYGQDGGKISFLVLAGHGNRDEFYFGENVDNPGARIRTKDFWMREVLEVSAHPTLNLLNRIGDCFSNYPTVIFDSCDAGREEGLGQQISTEHAEVIAPRGQAGVNRFRVAKDGDRFRFDVRYTGGVKSARYIDGVEVD